MTRDPAGDFLHPRAAAGPQARAPRALPDRVARRVTDALVTASAKRSAILTATKRRSPSLLARRRSADLRPSFLSASMRFCDVVGRRHRLLRDLDDDVAGLQPLLGGGAAVGDLGHHDAA